MNFKINNILGFVDQTGIVASWRCHWCDDLASEARVWIIQIHYRCLSIEYVLAKTQDVKLNIKDVVW
ncbi:MAG: hypothetical protein IPO26_21710 [Saprospiraceae bacterium]|nr:hypothetical protein [Saprospiraceae bacterium]